MRRGIASVGGRIASLVPSRASRLIERHRRNILQPLGLDVSSCRVYGSVASSILDFIRLSYADDNAFRREVEVEGASNLESALSKGRGALCITAHYGAWELIPRAVILLGHRAAVIGRRLFGSAAEHHLASLRTRHGVISVDRSAGARKLLGLLRENTAVGILIDQDTTAVESDFVDFFGIPALTPVGPARIAAKFGIPVVPLHIARRKNGSHLLVIEEPIDTEGYAEGDGYLVLTARLNSIIEGWIRQDPSQWIWFHERWCRRPPGSPGLR